MAGLSLRYYRWKFSHCGRNVLKKNQTYPAFDAARIKIKVHGDDREAQFHAGRKNLPAKTGLPKFDSAIKAAPKGFAQAFRNEKVQAPHERYVRRECPKTTLALSFQKRMTPLVSTKMMAWGVCSAKARDNVRSRVLSLTSFATTSDPGSAPNISDRCHCCHS